MKRERERERWLCDLASSGVRQSSLRFPFYEYVKGRREVERKKPQQPEKSLEQSVQTKVLWDRGQGTDSPAGPQSPQRHLPAMLPLDLFEPQFPVLSDLLSLPHRAAHSSCPFCPFSRGETALRGQSLTHRQGRRQDCGPALTQHPPPCVEGRGARPFPRGRHGGNLKVTSH